MKKAISRFYSSQLLGRIFHTLEYCLQRELRDCRSVLDLGCGPRSPLAGCKNVDFSVGVDAHKPYLDRARKEGVHTECILSKIEELNFPQNKFDAVILIDVLEHLEEETALKVLRLAEMWAGKKVIVTSPNGFVEQPEIDDNPYQRHLSGWSYHRMKELGFKSYGLAGLKFLRKEKEEEDSMDEDLTVSIRFEPKAFWFTVATLSQLFTYYVPSLAFGLFNVKSLENE